MSKIIDAVSVVLMCEEEMFAISRQPFLKAFPGYWAFPGGKVEAHDDMFFPRSELVHGMNEKLIGAVIRETQEELGIDLADMIKQGQVKEIHQLGLAVTPDFNPYRFATYFFKIILDRKPVLTVDRNEAQMADWFKASALLKQFERGELLAVPPVIKVIETLGRQPHCQSIPDLNFEFDNAREVPFIESIKGVRQIMPLSHTLPPANRTNSFLIGGNGHTRILIDPSPKDEQELIKFMNVIRRIGVDALFLTHHHPDHHEFAPKIARAFAVPIYMSVDTHQRLLKKMGSDWFTGLDVHHKKEGDIITQWLGHDIKVWEVPGHDEGQLAVAPVNMAWFLAGDLFQGIGTVVIGGEEGDMNKYMNTLRKVINLAPKVLYPSHGIALGGTGILERTLEHRQLREEQILELYNSGKSEDEILMSLYSDIHVGLHPYARANIRSHLAKLRSEQKLS